jgi:hypothetical protein
MAKITFIQPDGSEQVVAGDPGMTVMETAKKNLVAGIEGPGAAGAARAPPATSMSTALARGWPLGDGGGHARFASTCDRRALELQIKVSPRRPDPESAREAVL